MHDFLTWLTKDIIFNFHLRLFNFHKKKESPYDFLTVVITLKYAL